MKKIKDFSSLSDDTKKILLTKLSQIGMAEINIYKITQYQYDSVTFYEIEFTPSYESMGIVHEFGSIALGEIFLSGKAWICGEDIATLSLDACLGKVETQEKCETVLSWGQIEKILETHLNSGKINGSNKAALTEVEFLYYPIYKEDENKLDDMSISESDKNRIYYFRKRYFRSIGIKIDAFSLDDKESYEAYIAQGYKKLVPTQELIEEITKLKEKAYSECKKEFIYNSKDFIRNSKIFDNTERNKEAIYSRVKDSQICITGGSSDENFITILFFTIRNNCGGILDYVLLHEMGHAIETEDMLGKGDYRSGFEFGTVNVPENPYNQDKRKYERLNETIRDMLTLEAREILHEQGIYFFEQKELIKDAKNNNTHSICKDLLKTFLSEYREEIIGVLLHGDIDTLYNRVGEENFEELVDIVNRVDNLYGLVPKLENMQNEDPTVVEYHEQLERLSKVYANMERHQIKEESANDLLQSAINATEETTRLGSIEDAIASISNTFEQNFEEDKTKQECERNQ